MERDPHTAAVALVSMPWSLFSRPSIQLGALQAYLENCDDISIDVDCYHPYLGAAKKISIEAYSYLSKKSWAGEALYAALLHPERKPSQEKVFRKNCSDNRTVAASFHTLADALEEHLESWVESVDFGDYDLVGFTICFSQLFSSLAAAQKIKDRFPHIRTVFGGSSCVGKIGISLAAAYNQVDFIIKGEGEIQLKELCREHLQGTIAAAESILRNVDKEHPNDFGCRQTADLNTFPSPDYHSYFEELRDLFPSVPFSPTLPIEFSRGCWWGKCSFCNLNLQWHNYRNKNAGTLIREVNSLREEYRCLDFSFCDNALPPQEADAFFRSMAESSHDYNFFAEIRVIKNPEALRLYKEGGLNSVQVGIESLSTSLLKKMEKGVRVIDNIAIMKYCAENNIALEGNLIVEFPGSTSEEVDETLAALDFVFPYNPLTAATFFLGYGSPVDTDPGNFNIHRIVPHPNTYSLLPQEKLKIVELLIRDYHGDKMKQRKQWKPVRAKINSWKKYHLERSGKTAYQPLNYRDGGTFLIIRQEKPSASPLLHRLQGTSRELYLFCNTIKNIAEVQGKFPNLAEKTLLNFFQDLSNKHLLYMEGDNYLSLAVRQQWN